MKVSGNLNLKSKILPPLRNREPPIVDLTENFLGRTIYAGRLIFE